LVVGIDFVEDIDFGIGVVAIVTLIVMMDMVEFGIGFVENIVD